MADKTNVTVEKLPASRVVLKATIGNDERTNAEQKVLKAFSEKMSFPGFRPGHAPLDKVREKVQPEQLLEETVRILVRESLPAWIDEQNIQPILPPRIELQSKDPFELHVTFVEKPDIKMSKKTFSVKKEKPKVEDKDIERILHSLQEERKTTKKVERAATNGDEVLITFSASHKGEDIADLKGEKYGVVLGSKQLLPGMEEELIGLKPQEQKAFDITLPKKYADEKLQGKKVTFDVFVDEVHEVELPTLTDAYVKENLQAASLEDLKSKIRDSLVQQEDMMYRMKYERELLQQIAEAVKMEIAPELEEEELRSLIETWSQQLQQQGMSIEQWLQQQNKKPEELQKELAEQAKKRLKTRFGLATLIDEHKITVSDEQVAMYLQGKQVEKTDPQWQQARWQAQVETLIAKLLED